MTQTTIAMTTDVGTQRPSGVAVTVGLLIVAAIMAAGVWGVRQPDVLPIRQVHIQGELLRLDGNHFRASFADEVKGGFFTIDVAAIRDVLMTLPWVETVSVHRVWPDVLRVVVREKTAMARWNASGLLSTEGVYFAPDKNSFPEGLPLLEGPEESRPLLLERFYLLTRIHGLKVVSLRLDTRRAWSFELESGLRVLLGRRDFETRVRRFAEVVRIQLAAQLPEIDTIDMRYTNGFTVSRRRGEAD